MIGVRLDELRLRRPHEARHIVKTAGAREVREGDLHRLLLACAALRPELLALLEEILEEHIAREHILFPCAFQRNQAAAHDEILVALCRDFLLHIGEF